MAGRPKGSKNKAKEVPAADGSTTSGDNGSPENGAPTNQLGELTEDQKIALFFNHKRTYEGALAKKKEADAHLKNACKLIKAEGTKLADIKLALELDEEEGDAALKQRIEDQLRIARWMGSAVGTQFEFDLAPDRTPSVDKAYAEGKRAGLAGETAGSHYAPGTEQFESYMKGWHEGQAVLAKGFTPLQRTAALGPDSDAEFDDATASKPSRRRQDGAAPGAKAAGTYEVH